MINYNDESINMLLNKYINIIDNLCANKQYNSNIKHLLYMIVPAFIIKYGINNERTILDCFSNTDILTSNIYKENVNAYFDRNLFYQNGNYLVKNYVVISDSVHNYIDLLDSVVHEFNHVINSYNNPIIIKDKYIYLRTGISTIKYSVDDIKKPLEKSVNYVLEEILNTKQTEEIIKIILDLKKYKIENNELNNMLLSLNGEIVSGIYNSKAYYYQAYITKELIKNRTFISTIEKLRYNGDIEYIDEWFDNIVGKSGKYRQLYVLLYEIMGLEQEYSKTKIFKKHKLLKIKDKSEQLLKIIDDFNNNCILN